ncbi:hypothetical protein VKT23_012711 [Stygiomarasmius scandens]|uniref:DUF6535 domain-containing protein n=1 Tax=Marasmiellus scandens TaxID=2682957 RepID=A0ABR1J5N9_9AGAR
MTLLEIFRILVTYIAVAIAKPLPKRNLNDHSEQKERYQPTVDDEACSKLWAVYIDEARRYDEDLLKGWQDDMDGMLLFSALYSASLTAFLIESYKTLQDDPAQNTVVLLSQITQQLASALNGTNASITQPLPATFDPPLSSIICNFFWFLSLALALTCSLLATFVKQWTRDFIHKTSLKPSPRHGVPRQDDTLTEAMLENSFKPSMERSDRDQKALLYTMKSLTDDNEFLPFIEAIPDVIYDSSRPTYVGPNTGLILPLLQSSDPEGNIIFRISKFIQRYQAWTDPVFRDRSTIACPKALWSLGWMFLNLGHQNRLDLSPEGVRAYRNFTQDVISYAPILLSLQGRYVHSALAVLRLSWLNSIRYSIAKVTEVLVSEIKFIQSVKKMSLSAETAVAEKCVTFARHMLGEIGLVETSYGPSTARNWFPTPYTHLIAVLNRDTSHLLTKLAADTSHTVNLAKLTTEIIVLLKDETWKSLRWHILHEYILISLDFIFSTSTLPHEFEMVCNLIFPPDESGSVDVNNPDVTGPLLRLKEYLADEAKISSMTDVLVGQYLKLFISAEPPPLTPNFEKEAESRRFVLWYFKSRASGDVTHRKVLALPDLSRIMSCILKELQHGSKEPDLCLRAALLSMTGSSRFIIPQPDGDSISDNSIHALVHDFPWKLWNALREPFSSLHECESYHLVRITAEARACTTMDAYRPSLDQDKLELYRDYLPQHTPLFSAASKKHRETLMINIVARFIDLSCEQKLPSQLGVALRALCGPEDNCLNFTDVYETGQLRFAACFTKLVDTLRAGEFESVYLSSSILGEFFNLSEMGVSESGVALLWSWEYWITSVRCARKMVGALKRLKKSACYHEYAEANDNLLEHCKEVISEHISRFQQRRLGKKKSQVLASKGIKRRRGVLSFR